MRFRALSIEWVDPLFPGPPTPYNPNQRPDNALAPERLDCRTSGQGSEGKSAEPPLVAFVRPQTLDSRGPSWRLRPQHQQLSHPTLLLLKKSLALVLLQMLMAPEAGKLWYTVVSPEKFPTPFGDLGRDCDCD